jgi:iron complex outermembrane receptor protein
MPGAIVADGTGYRESLGTKRIDIGTLWQRPVAGRYLLSARATLAGQTHDRWFGDVRERDRLRTAFGEVTLRGTRGAHTWVGGIAIEHEAYTPVDVDPFAYTFTTPGVFAQDEFNLRSWLAVSLSGRLDHHSRYGWFFSPRLSALLRSGPWSTRVSAGRGFFGPSALTEETEAAGLTRLTLEKALEAEQGRSASLDVIYAPGVVSYAVTIFGSHITSPVQVDRTTYTIRNLGAPTTNLGVELLATFRRPPVALTSSYTYVRAREQVDTVTTDLALTPRHSAGWVAMVENDDGRLGLELYYTGRQRLEANPYRDTSRPYFVVGVLVERRVGPIRLFLNGENLTDVRQSRWSPLLLPTRSIDGRIFNGGVRIQF